MPIKDSKQKIFNSIGALKTLNDGYPKLKNSVNSFNSINNKGEVIEFLIDLIISLIGVEELKGIAANFLVTKLEELEPKLRSCIKNTLNEKINLGSNPSIPANLINGFDVKIKNIDFYGLLKSDPLGSVGSLLYDDNKSGLNSTDCDVFLFETLQDNTTRTWGNQVGKQSILDLKYDNNLLNIKVSSSFATSKKLKDLNNEYIDTIKLYSADKLVNNIFDKLFGVIASTENKTHDELFSEAKLNAIIDNLKNSEDGVIINDSYFTFTNDQVRKLEEDAQNRGNGISILVDCNNYASSISLESLSAATSQMKNATTFNELTTAVNKALTDLTDEATNGASDQDKSAAKAWFFKNIIKEMVNSVVASILTPKVIIAFMFNTSNNGDITPEKFMRDNRIIIKTVICSCKDSITDLLLNVVLKEVIKLTTEQVTNALKEAAKNKVLTTLSLIGVPQEMLAVIRGV